MEWKQYSFLSNIHVLGQSYLLFGCEKWKCFILGSLCFLIKCSLNKDLIKFIKYFEYSSGNRSHRRDVINKRESKRARDWLEATHLNMFHFAFPAMRSQMSNSTKENVLRWKDWIENTTYLKKKPAINYWLIILWYIVTKKGKELFVVRHSVKHGGVAYQHLDQVQVFSCLYPPLLCVSYFNFSRYVQTAKTRQGSLWNSVKVVEITRQCLQETWTFRIHNYLKKLSIRSRTSFS